MDVLILTLYMKEFKEWHSEILSWYIHYFVQKALEKQQIQGEASWELTSQPKADPPKGAQLSSIIPRGVLSRKEDSLLSREETKSKHHTHANFVTTTMPPIYLRAHSSFPKIIYFPLSNLYPLSFHSPY